ncbi:MAG: hypothetical protein ACI35O_13585 [Bacillaceae bacterium]
MNNRLPDLTEEEKSEGMDGVFIVGGAIVAYFLDRFFDLPILVISLITTALIIFCREWVNGKKRDGIAFLTIAIITSILAVTFDLGDRVIFVITLGFAFLYSLIFLKKNVSDMIKSVFSINGLILIVVIGILFFLF